MKLIVMEANNINESDEMKNNVIGRCCKVRKIGAYAGLLLFLVPSVVCRSGWSNHLTYEQIYNNTEYAQLYPKLRPAYKPMPPRNHTKFKDLEDSHGNELELDESDTPRPSGKGLLVGFSHDPFRYSIPEEDYLKGMRTLDPQTYMKSERGKRGVVHLYNMMYCATGCDPLMYKGYGCYCGFLGEGRPTDGIDNCCKMHDECYENLYCPLYTVYFQPYYWKCYRGEPLCALENYNTQHQFINGCAARLCECDRRFAMCIRRYRCPRRRALCKSSPLRLLQNLLMFK